MGEIVCTTQVQPHWAWDGVLLGGGLSAGDAVFQPFWLRRLGTHIIGPPGGGKSFLMLSMAYQDILRTHGHRVSMVLMDPHGPLYQGCCHFIARHGLWQDLPIRLIDPGNLAYTVGLNPLRRRPGVRAEVIATAFRDFLMRCLFHEDPADKPQTGTTLFMLGLTLYEFERPLTDAVYLLAIDEDETGFRAQAARESTDPAVRQFWRGVEAAKKPADRMAILGSSMRRLTDILVSSVLRRMFSARENVLNMREIMDRGEILLINLATGDGRLSEEEQKIIAAMITYETFMASLGRSEGATPCMFYMDECHRFINSILARMFFEGRKFGIHPIIAHQTLDQFHKEGIPELIGTVLQARTKIVFGGLAANDLSIMVPEMYRGTFDLDTPRYTRHEVYAYLRGWALSQSEQESWAKAVGQSVSEGGNQSEASGASWARGGSEAREHSTGKNWGIQAMDGITIGRGRGKSNTVTENESLTRGRAKTKTKSVTDTESEAETVAVSDTTSSGQSLGGAEAYAYDYDMFIPAMFPHGYNTLETQSASESSAHTEMRALTRGQARAIAKGTATTENEAETTGRAVAASVSEEESLALSQGVGRTRGGNAGQSLTQGTNWSGGGTASQTDGRSWGRDQSHTDTRGQGKTTGRTEILSPQLREIPGAYWTLEELRYKAEVELSHQPAGTFVVRFEYAPPVRTAALYLEPVYAAPTHLAFATEQLHELSPFTTRAVFPEKVTVAAKPEREQQRHRTRPKPNIRTTAEPEKPQVLYSDEYAE